MAISPFLIWQVTAHSYEDVFLASKAEEYGVAQTFEVGALKSLFNLTPDGIEQARLACIYVPIY